MNPPNTTATKSPLDPSERFPEILFGLIMVLSFTCSLGVATAEREEIRTMLIGALGCNLAWGIVDAVMYIIASLSQRHREFTVLQMFRSPASTADLRAALEGVVPASVAGALTDDELAAIRQRMAGTEVAREGLRGSDLSAALAVFSLVFFSTFPVVIPFIVIREPVTALRVSNAIAIAMLYISGHSLGRFTGLRPWRIGLTMVLVGLVLVGVTIALGG